ncbi:hypothetical protein SY88_22815 [Clostridiales bacterium PH28_bin88]|nr:hypothetical protein SY88_22815 [Clostridiales bacterium PH28_bin88]
MVKVGLDIGHGGRDPGAIGPTGLQEKDVNLSVGLIVLSLLEGNGIETTVTRTTDVFVSLRQRSDMFNAADVDLVISVHVNKVADPAPNYVASFVYGRGGRAESAARLIQEELRRVTGWPGPHSPDGVMVRNLHMVRETHAPAVVVEMGFISNPEQERQLRDGSFHRVLAVAIAKGICRHFSLPFREVLTENLPPGIVPATLVGGLKPYA